MALISTRIPVPALPVANDYEAVPCQMHLAVGLGRKRHQSGVR